MKKEYIAPRAAAIRLAMEDTDAHRFKTEH